MGQSHNHGAMEPASVILYGEALSKWAVLAWAWLQTHRKMAESYPTTTTKVRLRDIAKPSGRPSVTANNECRKRPP